MIASHTFSSLLRIGAGCLHLSGGVIHPRLVRDFPSFTPAAQEKGDRKPCAAGRGVND